MAKAGYGLRVMAKIPPDLLPDAASAARVTRAMLDMLASHGYARLAPSMVEFEETMAARSGGMMRNRLLRFSDPVSGHTLALRGVDGSARTCQVVICNLTGETHDHQRPAHPRRTLCEPA